ncbi:MAG: hypothetical protein HKN57_08140 [Xanthomonadales bacterium]|nr:hypothetical protein [Gammaproteobacteria bacterium]NND57208.1 hypothetical protein [Xanthomonadales bacterium]
MEQYLRLYAEPETAALHGLVEALGEKAGWEQVVVIPACNESAEFLRPPPTCAGRSLMVLVINESESAFEQISLNNRKLAYTVERQFEPVWESDANGADIQMKLLTDASALRDVLLVDRFSPGRELPVKGGVGHARKIGADLACWLIGHQKIGSEWIHCTDADVELPDTYFSCTDTCAANRSQYAAMIHPFRHCGREDTSESRDVLLATRLYEISLHYYVAGMRFAGSPYAFHTIGSTLAINAAHYAKVRGFPKRQAGEDFYLLNKLAKVGKVLELDAGRGCEPITIAARRSDRVPFGTGAAVNSITRLDDPPQDFRFYHPAVFESVRQWLQSWPLLWQSRSATLAGYPPELLAGLEALGTRKALVHALAHSRDEDQFNRQMHTWFDAFRTLKLIHFLRDEYFPSVHLAQLAANPLFTELLDRDANLQRCRQRLIQDFPQHVALGA